MISIGKPSWTGRRTGRTSRRPTPAVNEPASELGSTQPPGSARQCSARRVAVIVAGNPGSAAALRQAASQARQRNATLDVICLLPGQPDEQAVTMARVQLGVLSRRACPFGVGVPVRFRVEHGDADTVRSVIQADVELLVSADLQTIHPG